MRVSNLSSTSRIAADREEFATRVADLSSDAEWKRQRARKWVEQQTPEQVVAHILALWQDEEVQRRRYHRIGRGLLYSGAVGMFSVVVVNGMLLRNEATWEATRSLQPLLVYLRGGCILTMQASTFCFLHRFPTARQKGIARLLLQHKDPRLLGPMLDTLSFYDRIIENAVDAPMVRYRLIQRLTSLLSEVGHADLPPLDLHQRRVLLTEIKRCARRLRKGGELNDDETAFLIAALGALEREPASGLGQTQRVRQQEEKVLMQVAQATSAADDGANGRQVREAAEDCLVRLRAQ